MSISLRVTLTHSKVRWHCFCAPGCAECRHGNGDDIGQRRSTSHCPHANQQRQRRVQAAGDANDNRRSLHMVIVFAVPRSESPIFHISPSESFRLPNKRFRLGGTEAESDSAAERTRSDCIPKRDLRGKCSSCGVRSRILPTITALQVLRKTGRFPRAPCRLSDQVMTGEYQISGDLRSRRRHKDRRSTACRII